MKAGPTLEADRLTVDFKRRGAPPLRAVDAVSFALHAGHTLALVGESGSGKSTVVRALSRLVAPSAGEVRLDGEARVRDAAYRRSVQMVFQDPFASLNPAHTVGHHLRRPLLVSGRATRADVDARVEELLTSVNLTPAADIARKRPHELSGGQRQRVAIARALAPEPEVLLADEPVSMLDVSIRLEILGLLDRLKEERRLALLYVTHDLATARHFAADVMVMYRGQIVERGPSDEVILRPRHPYTQLLASAAPGATGSRERAREARAARLAARDARTAELRETTAHGGCRFRARCPFATERCAQDPPAVALQSPGHEARCWLYEEPVTAGPARAEPG
ncbi:ABC transporter ATP-binding protein [Streptomyces sp. VRA16 Mangrove soil]|uniref:ABC transporter ATP-binding protein n=1 Tax=Streptomyces sp. VRA16 Mangrove soil TaxID=2817434 RepID=UPI001A9FF680|nr:ABC transporter ATP-binding protein [Streptomyces sp. VRA16 Mangrove soil]MBO1331245.1 ABC transporter ATP-binding protein [Streptomyces sp. VRA16 Mangrove soil]